MIAPYQGVTGQYHVVIDQYQVVTGLYQVVLDQYQVLTGQYQVVIDQYQAVIRQYQLVIGQFQGRPTHKTMTLVTTWVVVAPFEVKLGPNESYGRAASD